MDVQEVYQAEETVPRGRGLSVNIQVHRGWRGEDLGEQQPVQGPWHDGRGQWFILKALAANC